MGYLLFSSLEFSSVEKNSFGRQRFRTALWAYQFDRYQIRVASEIRSLSTRHPKRCTSHPVEPPTTMCTSSNRAVRLGNL